MAHLDAAMRQRETLRSIAARQMDYFRIKERRAIEGGGSLLNARLFNQSSSLTAGRPVAGRRLQPNFLGFALHIIRRRLVELYSVISLQCSFVISPYR